MGVKLLRFAQLIHPYQRPTDNHQHPTNRGNEPQFFAKWSQYFVEGNNPQ